MIYQSVFKILRAIFASSAVQEEVLRRPGRLLKGKLKSFLSE